jgi:hypothetical protein
VIDLWHIVMDDGWYELDMESGCEGGRQSCYSEIFPG